MNLDKLRILGSSFTEEEYRLYRFDQLRDADEATRFLSHRQNHEIFRPAVNRGFQQHFLEDKWVVQLFLSSLGIAVPRTYGLYHPQFGVTADGAALRTPAQLEELIAAELPLRLVLKPRGGRKGRNIMLVDVYRDSVAGTQVSVDGVTRPFADFIADLPEDAFGDYDGCYHGWLVQACLRQDAFLDRINPYTVNSFRVVTFIDAEDVVRIHHTVLRLGRKGSAADNWDKGGLSVFVDPETGVLGRGVFKPRYGGAWVSEHPDTGVHFEGQQVPGWSRVLDVCQRAAAMFSGIRAVGWDVALTPEGPVIIEGNATWGLPVVQVHTCGYLSDEIKGELAGFGARFPDRLRPLPLALLALLVYQWRRSRAPRILQAARARLQRLMHIV